MKFAAKTLRQLRTRFQSVDVDAVANSLIGWAERKGMAVENPDAMLWAWVKREALPKPDRTSPVLQFTPAPEPVLGTDYGAFRAKLLVTTMREGLSPAQVASKLFNAADDYPEITKYEIEQLRSLGDNWLAPDLKP